MLQRRTPFAFQLNSVTVFFFLSFTAHKMLSQVRGTIFRPSARPSFFHRSPEVLVKGTEMDTLSQSPLPFTRRWNDTGFLPPQVPPPIKFIRA